MRNLLNAAAVRRALIPYGTRTPPRNKATGAGKGLITMAAALALLIPALAVRAGDHQSPESQPTEVRLLASGLMGTIGSTIGPDGALYVAEGALGRITRINLST